MTDRVLTYVRCAGCQAIFAPPVVEGRTGLSYDRESLSCPSCGHSHIDLIFSNDFKIGMGVYNQAALDRLILYGEDRND